MRSYSILTLSLAASLLAGCSHTSERLDQKLATWVGRTPDDLIESWGAPRSTYVMDKGVKVLTYEASETINRFSGYFRRPDYYSYTDTCKVNFFTDASQKQIARTSFSGSASACSDLVRNSSQQQN